MGHFIEYDMVENRFKVSQIVPQIPIMQIGLRNIDVGIVTPCPSRAEIMWQISKTIREIEMTKIGSFKKVAIDYEGEIVTLSLQSKDVKIIAQTGRFGGDPDFRIYCGRVEIGYANLKMSDNGEHYLFVMLDDPSFTAPIYAKLELDNSGDRYDLVWSRALKPDFVNQTA